MRQKVQELIRIERWDRNDIRKISDRIATELPLTEELITEPKTMRESRTLSLRDDLGQKQKIKASIDPEITIPISLWE